MIKLADLINEIEQDKLEEAGWKDLVAAVGLTAATILGGGAKAQSTAPADINTMKTQTIPNLPKWQAEKYVDTKVMKDWNKFVKWLSETTVEDLSKYITTEYEGSGKLAGNKIMNHEDYSDAVLEVYTKVFDKSSSLSKKLIIPIQSQIRDYRNYLINGNYIYRVIKKVPNESNPFRLDFTPKADYSNLMSDALKAGEDGIVGVFTSQIFFPGAYLKVIENGKQVDFKSLGYAEKNIK